MVSERLGKKENVEVFQREGQPPKTDSLDQLKFFPIGSGKHTVPKMN